MKNTNKVSRDVVIDQDRLRVSNAIANMFNWNYTTFIRTYSLLTSTLIDKWAKKIANRRPFDAVWYTIEKDDNKQPPTNHVHFAIATKKPIDASRVHHHILTTLPIKEKHIGNIEPIRGKEETIHYINKRLIRNDRYINTHYNIFTNKSKN
tara:strand:+ start:178 stop:630 length:453 start_codon:yes stop_codon:yes gene_type:complete